MPNFRIVYTIAIHIYSGFHPDFHRRRKLKVEFPRYHLQLILMLVYGHALSTDFQARTHNYVKFTKTIPRFHQKACEINPVGKMKI